MRVMAYKLKRVVILILQAYLALRTLLLRLTKWTWLNFLKRASMKFKTEYAGFVSAIG